MDSTALFILILCSSSTWGSILPGGSHHHDHKHDHHPDQHGDHHHGHHDHQDHHNNQDHSDHQTSTSATPSREEINVISEPANQLASEAKRLTATNSSSQSGNSVRIVQGVIQPTNSASTTRVPIISPTQPRPHQIIQQLLINQKSMVQDPSAPTSSPKLLQSEQQDIPLSSLHQTQQMIALQVAGQLNAGLSQLIQQSAISSTTEQQPIKQTVPVQQPEIPNAALTPPVTLVPTHAGHLSANQQGSLKESENQVHGHKTTLENPTTNPKPSQQTVQHSTGSQTIPHQVSGQVNVPQNSVSQSIRSSVSGNALEYNPNLDYSGLFLEKNKKFDGSDNKISKSLNSFGFNRNYIGSSNKGTSGILGINNLINGVNHVNTGSGITNTNRYININNNNNNNLNPTSSTVCKHDEVKNVRGVCVKPQVSHNIYVFAPPTRPPRLAGKTWSSRPVPVPKVEYNIVFVRAPDAGEGAEPIIVGPPQQKTLVYVLSKKDQETDPRIIEVPTGPKHRPEVYYVNYNEGENPQLPGGIDLNDALKSSSQPGQNFDLSNDAPTPGAGAVKPHSTSGFLSPAPIQPSQFVANLPTPQPTNNPFLPQRSIQQLSNPGQVSVGPTQIPTVFVTAAPQQSNNFAQVSNLAWPQSQQSPHVLLHGVAVTQPSANIPFTFGNQAVPQPVYVQSGQGYNPFLQTFIQPQNVQG